MSEAKDKKVNFMRREREGIQLWVYRLSAHLQYVWFQRSDGVLLVPTHHPYTGKMRDLYDRFDAFNQTDLQWLSNLPVIERERNNPDWIRATSIIHRLAELRG